MNKQSTIDVEEVAKFAQHAAYWWDETGPFKTLHAINPARLAFIDQYHNLSQCTVLDVGCGGGILCEAMASIGAKVTGLDVEGATIKAAKAHAKERKLRIDYQSCAIEDFTGTLFDVVTCMEMLEHVPDPQLVIQHCARLLKPGGMLFLSTINRTFKAYALAIVAAEYLLGLLPRQTHDFAKFIKPSELVAMVRTAKLELKGLSGIAYNPWNNTATLQKSVDVGYLVACQKSQDLREPPISLLKNVFNSVI